MNFHEIPRTTTSIRSNLAIKGGKKNGRRKRSVKQLEKCDPRVFGDLVITLQSPPPLKVFSNASGRAKSSEWDREDYSAFDTDISHVDDVDQTDSVTNSLVPRSSSKVSCSSVTTTASSTPSTRGGVGSYSAYSSNLNARVLPPLPLPDPEFNRRKASALLDELLMDIYSNNFLSSDYTSATSSRSQRSFGGLRDDLHECDVSELSSLSQWLSEEVGRAGSVLVRQLKRRDALRRQQDAHCNVISNHLRRLDDGNEIRFTVEPAPGESGFAQWHSAMRMVAQLPEGIPQEFRRQLWLSLADRHLAGRRVDWARAERTCFSEWSHPQDSELGVQIVKDLHRTGCSLFCGEDGQENQALLKRVLLAYARWNKAVGYCQGFNMLAALILQVTERNEVEALKLMIYLIEGVLPESYFADNLRGLSVDMAVFRELLRARLPRLSRHLDALQVAARDGTTSYEPPLTNVFTMQWFLTLFCNCLPQPTVLRVWDLILLEGNEVLLRTALAIWQALSERILAVRSADEFYCIMGVLTREMLEFGLVDANSLIRAVVTIGKLSELSSLRDKHLYNITPWGNAISSGTDADSEPEERALRLYPRERLALDISALKQQYSKLKQRQRQAHIILTAAVARQPSPRTPVAMNHLLLGKSALMPAKRLGPPAGAVPPARGRPETLHWRDAPRQSSSSSSSSSTELCDDPEERETELEVDVHAPELPADNPEIGDNNLMTSQLTRSDGDETADPVNLINTKDMLIEFSNSSSKSDVDLIKDDFGNVQKTDDESVLLSELTSGNSSNTHLVTMNLLLPKYSSPTKQNFVRDSTNIIDSKEFDTLNLNRRDSLDSDESFDFEKFLQDRARCLTDTRLDVDVKVAEDDDITESGIRNSQLAFQIMQENSMILHRILQCQRSSPMLVDTESPSTLAEKKKFETLDNNTDKVDSIYCTQPSETFSQTVSPSLAFATRSPEDESEGSCQKQNELPADFTLFQIDDNVTSTCYVADGVLKDWQLGAGFNKDCSPLETTPSQEHETINRAALVDANVDERHAMKTRNFSVIDSVLLAANNTTPNVEGEEPRRVIDLPTHSDVDDSDYLLNVSKYSIDSVISPANSNGSTLSAGGNFDYLENKLIQLDSDIDQPTEFSSEKNNVNLLEKFSMIDKDLFTAKEIAANDDDTIKQSIDQTYDSRLIDFDDKLVKTPSDITIETFSKINEELLHSKIAEFESFKDKDDNEDEVKFTDFTSAKVETENDEILTDIEESNEVTFRRFSMIDADFFMSRKTEFAPTKKELKNTISLDESSEYLKSVSKYDHHFMLPLTEDRFSTSRNFDCLETQLVNVEEERQESPMNAVESNEITLGKFSMIDKDLLIGKTDSSVNIDKQSEINRIPSYNDMRYLTSVSKYEVKLSSPLETTEHALSTSRNFNYLDDFYKKDFATKVCEDTSPDVAPLSVYKFDKSMDYEPITNMNILKESNLNVNDEKTDRDSKIEEDIFLREVYPSSSSSELPDDMPKIIKSLALVKEEEEEDMSVATKDNETNMKDDQLLSSSAILYGTNEMTDERQPDSLSDIGTKVDYLLRKDDKETPEDNVIKSPTYERQFHKYSGENPSTNFEIRLRSPEVGKPEEFLESSTTANAISFDAENSSVRESSRMKHCLKSPPSSERIFNPFPVRPAARQPKDVAVRLGLYKK